MASSVRRRDRTPPRHRAIISADDGTRRARDRPPPYARSRPPATSRSFKYTSQVTLRASARASLRALGLLVVLVDVPRERRAGRDACTRTRGAPAASSGVRAAEARRAGVPYFVHRRGDAAPRGAAADAEVAPHASPRTKRSFLRLSFVSRVGAEYKPASHSSSASPRSAATTSRARKSSTTATRPRATLWNASAGTDSSAAVARDECARERGVQPHLCNVQTSRDGVDRIDSRCAPLRCSLQCGADLVCWLMSCRFDARATPPSQCGQKGLCRTP